MKQILISLLLLLSSCITGASRLYTAVVPCELVILEKKYIPGFQNPDRYLLKVLDNQEYRWLSTTITHYNSVIVGDTIKSVVLTGYNMDPKSYSYRPP